MQTALLGHYLSNWAYGSSENDPLLESFRQVFPLPHWQLLLITSDDGLCQVNLQSYQSSKDMPTNQIVDEILFRYASRLLPDAQALELFHKARGNILALKTVSDSLKHLLSKAPSFSSQMTPPQAFLNASDVMLAQAAGFIRLESGVKSSTSRLRGLLFPSERVEVPSALSKALARMSDPGKNASSVVALSDATLAAKLLEMVHDNELAQRNAMVYGLKTLKVYLPLMAVGLLDGVSSTATLASLNEYADSSQQLLAHLRRCERQVRLAIDSQPSP